jgi:pimeloyl-ACP methyl ester carboxylesterase
MTVPAYLPRRAQLLACASAQAYTAPEWRGRTVYNAETDTLAWIVESGQDVIVAFRGTAHRRNWHTDIDCRLINVGAYRVHRGFLYALESVIERIGEELDELAGRPLWLTGHSLGGALAMLCARCLQRRVAGVYTFGQPRAGDSAFCQSYDSFLGGVTYRVVHADDIVPRLPWLLGHYRHAGQEVFFPSRAKVTWQLNTPWRQKALSDLRGLAREAWHGRDALLADHHLDTYLKLLGVEDAQVATLVLQNDA